MTSSNSREMKQKLSGFKTEVANSMNISLNQGYNGDISARDAGRIGGQNAQHKDWECTEEMMKLTKGGKALYMHCLPADIMLRA